MRPRRRAYSLIELLVGMTLCALLFGVTLAFAVTGARLWHLGANKVDVNEAALITLHTFQAYMSASHIQSVYINPTGVQSGVSFLSALGENGIPQYVVSTPAPVAACPPPAGGPPQCPGGTCGGSDDRNQVAQVVCCVGGCTGCGKGCKACKAACTGATLSTPPPLPYAQDGYPLWQEWMVLYFDPATKTVRLGQVKLPTPTIAPNPYRLTSYTPSAADHIVASNVQSLTISTSPLDTPCGAAVIQAPLLNPIYVELTVQKPETNVLYTATLTTAIYMDNGFDNGVNTGEAASKCACPVCPSCVATCKNPRCPCGPGCGTCKGSGPVCKGCGSGTCGGQ